MANPLLIKLIPSIIHGAMRLIKDKKEFKKNLKTKTTAAAVVLAASVPALPEVTGDNVETMIVQVVMSIVSLGLFLYNKKK